MSAHDSALFCAGHLGMEDEPLPNRLRWAAAVERMAMALSEAGYPTAVHAVGSRPGRENEMVFQGAFPPDEVLLRAGELCGIRDLIEESVITPEVAPCTSHFEVRVDD